MSTTEDTARRRSSYWRVILTRAALACALGVFITLSFDHSAALGLVSFGAFSVLVSILLVFTLTQLEAQDRTLVAAQGGILFIAGTTALVWHDGGLEFLIYVVSFTAIVTGFLELANGIRARRRSPLGREWVASGGFTVLLAIVFLLVPPDFRQALGGDNKVKGFLTADVILVGILGAYAVILGVYLAIAGFSLKWAQAHARAATGG